MNYRKKQYRYLIRFCICILLIVIFSARKDIALGLANGCGAPQFGEYQANVGVGIGPRSIATGDFNHDGAIDLAVANYGSGQGAADGGISILLNNGAGGFSTPKNLSAGINPRSIVSADFNNDGILDLAVLNNVNGNCCIAGFATIFLGDGTGNFTPTGSPFNIGSDPSSLTVGDFNRDGKIDLAVTLSSSVSVLLGNGAGGFGSVTTYQVNSTPTSIATGDFNGDGKPDLVTNNLNGIGISVLLGDGSGGFGPQSTFNTGGNPRFVALGDLNQDSKLDVVTVDTLGRVSILLGTGTGNFGPPALFAVSQSPQSALVKDFNSDGRLDLVTANSGTNDVSVLIGDGTGNFGSQRNYNVGGSAFFVTSADINGDGKPDLITANVSTNSVTILGGDGVGGFAGARTFNVGLTPLAVAGGDFNGDGKPDLVAANANQDSVSVLLGDGSGGFGAEVKYPAGFSPRQIVVGDYNGDGKLDLAVADGTCCQIKQSVSILLGNGNGGFSAPMTFSAGTNAMAIASADFNNDGKSDLVVTNNADYNISLLIGNGDGTFAAPLNFTLPDFATPTDIAIGDFDGDGNTDLAVATGNIYLLMGNGAGGFSLGSRISMPGAITVAVGDINGDGKADLATANSTGSLSVLLGDGHGSFGSPNNLPIASPSDVVLGDFNGDGMIDLAASSGSTSVAIFLGDGAGGFGPATSFNVGSSPKGILAIDLNGDSRLDLATANLGDNISVLLDTCSEVPAVPPSISVNNVSLLEGNSGQTNASFTVTLSQASAQTVTVSYYTIGQSATAGSDYQPVSSHITFSPGTTSQSILVPVLGDTNIEPDETFLVQLRDALNANILVGQGKGTILNDDTAIQFSSAIYSFGEAVGQAQIIVTRTGNTSTASTVNYATSDTAGLTPCSTPNTGIASSRCDYATTSGTFQFTAGETAKTIFIPIVDDAYSEGNESFTITLSNPQGATLGTQSSATVTITDDTVKVGQGNPIDNTTFFVNQHYIDFLGRVSDAAYQGWLNVLNNCPASGVDANGNHCDRIEVSADFFRSEEFQTRGYFIYRFYKALPSVSDPNNPQNGHIPHYSEFMPDFARVNGPLTADQLEANKVAFINDFMTRSEYQTAYGAINDPTAYVNVLLLTVGLPNHPTRQTWIDSLTNGSMTKAQVLRALVESSEMYQKYYNEAFVIMQYFGYLRRDADLSYQQWLQTMNSTNGDYRTMINGFLNSTEYRQRFGP